MLSVRHVQRSHQPQPRHRQPADAVAATAPRRVSPTRRHPDLLNTVNVNDNVSVAATFRGDQILARFDRDPTSAATPIFDLVKAELPLTRSAVTTFLDNSLSVSRAIVEDGEVIGRIYIQSSLDELGARMRRLAVTIGAVLAASMTLAFVLSLKLQRITSGRCCGCGSHPSRLARSEVRRSRRTGRTDEVGVLIDGFNQMLAEIQRRDAQLLEHQDASRRGRDSHRRPADRQRRAAVGARPGDAGQPLKSEFLAI